MSKLKVGDKVRTIQAYPWVPTWRGLPGVVAEVLATGEVVVTFASGDIVESHERDFELIETKGLASEEELLQLQDTLPKPDEVNPTHYSGDLVMRVIEERGLDFALGNAVKYVCRAGSKGDKLTDLKKALWYLERAIAKEESAK